MRRAIEVVSLLLIIGSASVAEPCTENMCADDGFGSDGRVAIDFGFGDADRGNAVVRVPGEDRIYIIGQVTTAIAGDHDFGVACILDDGSPCPGFGNSGQITVAMDFTVGGLDAAIDGAVIPWPATGGWRLAVVGQVERSTAGDTDFGIALLRPDGSLETDASGGKAAVAFDAGADLTDVPAAVVATADGKILVGGTVDVAGDDSDWGFVRLNADLSPDVSFGTNSRAILGVAGLAVMHAMIPQTDGGIIAVGSREFGNDQMVIARLNADGSPDINFGILGQAVFEFPGPGPTDVAAWDVASDSLGRLVMVGGTENPLACLLAARVLADGQPDSTFNMGSAIESMCLSQTDIGGRAVEIFPDGTIVMALEFFQSDHDFVIYERPDQGPGAFLYHYPFNLGGSNDDRPRGILIQPDGKIVVAGRVVGAGGTIDFGALRVWSNQIFADGFEPWGSAAEWDLVVYNP